MGYAQATARLRRAIIKVAATGAAPVREVFGDVAKSQKRCRGPLPIAPCFMRLLTQPKLRLQARARRRRGGRCDTDHDAGVRRVMNAAGLKGRGSCRSSSQPRTRRWSPRLRTPQQVSVSGVALRRIARASIGMITTLDACRRETPCRSSFGIIPAFRPGAEGQGVPRVLAPLRFHSAQPHRCAEGLAAARVARQTGMSASRYRSSSWRFLCAPVYRFNWIGSVRA